MNKILNYIKAGRGIGAKFLLIYAFIVAIVYASSVKIMGNEIVPVLQNAADQLLPIKIENGTIVEPADTIKSIRLALPEVNFPFILDTTVDNIDTTDLKDGIYISKKAIYFVNKKQTKSYNFEDSLTLEKADYTDMFRKFATYVSVICGIFAFVFLYILYLAFTCFYALFAMAFTKMFKISLDYAASMRLSAVSYIATSAVSLLLTFAGLSTRVRVFFVSILILQIIIVKILKTNNA